MPSLTFRSILGSRTDLISKELVDADVSFTVAATPTAGVVSYTVHIPDHTAPNVMLLMAFNLGRHIGAIEYQTTPQAGAVSPHNT